MCVMFLHALFSLLLANLKVSSFKTTTSCTASCLIGNIGDFEGSSCIVSGL